VNGSSVPPAASATVARAAPGLAGATGIGPVSTATGSMAMAAPRNCTAVTATGSRSRSSPACATVNMADSSSDTSTRPSPPAVAPPPPPPLTKLTPASDSAKPAQATGRATVRCHTAAMTATRTGAAPISRAAWLTLVRLIPAFCTTTDPPYPIAPEARIAGESTARTRARVATRRMAAARPNRTNVSQVGDSQVSATLDSGTVVPQSSPAAVSAATARRRFEVIPTWSGHVGTEFAVSA
jgi:hypothetical protein